MEEMVPHPDWQALCDRRDALVAQIATVITDLHGLEDSRSMVLGRYAAAFGPRLTALHALEIEAARLKREIELIQAAVNSGAEINFEDIQATMEEEFAAWQAKLEAEAAGLAAQQAVLAHLMDPELCQAMKEKFRTLVRRLHPDLHPGQSDADAALWHRVAAAYENSDWEELTALEIITSDATPFTSRDSIQSLREHVAKLRAQLDQLLLTLEARGREWPFDQIPLLEDPEATSARQSELDARITATTLLRDQRKQWLSALLDQPLP